MECGRVAQLVEQRPFKAWVAGSNPAALTIFDPLLFWFQQVLPSPLRSGIGFRFAAHTPVLAASVVRALVQYFHATNGEMREARARASRP